MLHKEVLGKGEHGHPMICPGALRQVCLLWEASVQPPRGEELAQVSVAMIFVAWSGRLVDVCLLGCDVVYSARGTYRSGAQTPTRLEVSWELRIGVEPL